MVLVYTDVPLPNFFFCFKSKIITVLRDIGATQSPITLGY